MVINIPYIEHMGIVIMSSKPNPLMYSWWSSGVPNSHGFQPENVEICWNSWTPSLSTTYVRQNTSWFIFRTWCKTWTHSCWFYYLPTVFVKFRVSGRKAKGPNSLQSHRFSFLSLVFGGISVYKHPQSHVWSPGSAHGPGRALIDSFCEKNDNVRRWRPWTHSLALGHMHGNF